MGIEDFPKPTAVRDRTTEKAALHSKITQLIQQGVSLSRLAELLGAEEFIEYQSSGRNQGMVARLDVAGFVDWTLQSTQEQSYELQLPEHMLVLEGVILPPDEREGIQTGSGTGMEKRGYIPRTRYLIDLLSEMKIEYAVVDGTNTDEMMRQLSYKAFLLPAIGKMVLVCDEEGNATYVIDNIRGENWKQFIGMRKSELRSRTETGEVALVLYPGDSELWKNHITGLLYAEPSVSEKVEEIEIESRSRRPQGWLSALAIAKKLGKTDNWVKNRFAAFPDQTGKFGGRYYGSEQFYQSLKEEAEGTSKNENPDWLSGSEIVRLTGTTWNLFGDWIENYLEEHPDIKPLDKLKPNGNSAPHYPPEVTKQFQDFIQTRKENTAPEGWMTMRGLAEHLEVSVNYLESRVGPLVALYPDHVKDFYHNARNTKRTFYSPFFISKLQEIVKNDREMPADFVSIESVMHDNDLTYMQATLRLRNILKRDPSLESETKKSHKKGKLFISPKIVQLILTYLDK